MTRTALPAIRLLDELPTLSEPTSATLISGPFAGLVVRLPAFPEWLALAASRYERSVRCADDGQLRYVYVEPADRVPSDPVP
jgi:hypothetical protein